MKRRQHKSDCPVHFALGTFGDAWTLLIVRDLMFKGQTTYTELLNAEEGIATNSLADRLAKRLLADKARLSAELRAEIDKTRARYDPGITKSEVVSPAAEGLGR